MTGKWKVRRLKCAMDKSVHETVLFFETPNGKRRVGDWALEGITRRAGWVWSRNLKGKHSDLMATIAHTMGFERGPNSFGMMLSAEEAMEDHIDEMPSELEVRVYMEHVANRLNAEEVVYEW